MKEASKAPTVTLLALIEAVSRYAENPAAAVGLKALTGHAGTYRIRKGDWRLVFSIADGVLTITRIAPRGAVYK